LSENSVAPNLVAPKYGAAKINATCERHSQKKLVKKILVQNDRSNDRSTVQQIFIQEYNQWQLQLA
jgi:hypothetical protein